MSEPTAPHNDQWDEGFQEGRKWQDGMWTYALRDLSERWARESLHRKNTEDRYGGELVEQLRQEVEALIKRMA